MTIPEREYVFWKYLRAYGIFNEKGDLIGFKKEAPEEVKKSWQEYLKAREKWLEEGVQ